MQPRHLTQFVWCLVLVFGVALGWASLQALRASRGLESQARLRGQAEAARAARTFSAELAELEGAAHRLRLDLEAGQLKPGSLPGRMRAAMAAAPAACLRLGVRLEPGPGASGAAPFEAWVGRDGSLERPSPDGGRVGEGGRDGWGERHFARGVLVVDYAEPLGPRGAQGRAGLVRMEVGLEALQPMVAHAEAGSLAYGFLLSAHGVYLADPDTELVRTGTTFLDQATSLKDPNRRLIGTLALQGQAGFAEGLNAATGRPVWIMLEPIPRAHWSLGTVFLRDEIVVPSRTTPRLVIRIASLGVGLCLALLFLAFRISSPSLPRLWGFSISGSVVIALATALLWTFAYTLPQEAQGEDVKVTDTASLQAFLDQNAHLDAGVAVVQAEFVPTGVFVETLDFLDSARVRATGKVWQRFRKDGPPEARGGLTFPEALEGGIDPPVVREVGGEVIQFSPFKVILKQKMVSSPNYPFDHARVRLWVRPKALWRNELLVPDTRAYRMLLPDTLPGTDREMTVLGWKVETSFFSYMFQNYNANFGMDDYVGQRKQPELLFNIAMRREFLNPFIATFLPVLAVVGLLFAAHFTVTRDPERTKATTYQCFNFLRNAVSLFFPLVIAQFNLKSKVDPDRLIYAEHYYFVVYGMLLLTSVNALAYASSDHRLLAYEDNALPKLAFWPFLLACFYLVTVQFLT